MQVKHVTGISLTARRPTQKQGQFAVCGSLLGEVVINDQDVLALGHKRFTHSGSRKRGKIKQRGRVGGSSGDNDSILHRTRFLQFLQHVGHSGLFLAHGNVNADYISALLVNNGVNRNSSFAGLAVAKDKFPLAAANRDHRVNGLDPGLEGLVHRLPEDHAGGDFFYRVKFVTANRALPVQGLAQRVHHAADQGIAHRHGHDPAGALNGITLLDVLVRPENNAPDVVFFQVQGHPQHAAGEFQQFHGHTFHQAIHTGDTVTYCENGTDISHLDLGLVFVYLLPNNRADFFRSQIHLLVHPYLVNLLP